MAGFGQRATPVHDHIAATPAERQRPSTKRTLPEGPCNYRDLAFGACGCNQFWDKCSVDVHDGSTDNCRSSERSTWCVCGHHACFHLHQPRADGGAYVDVAAAPFRELAASDARYQLQSGSQTNAQHGVTSNEREAYPPADLQAPVDERLKASHSGKSQRMIHLGFSQANEFAVTENPQLTSDLSMSGLPRVPSICLMSQDRRDRRAADENRARQARTDLSQLRHGVTGLGLSFPSSAMRNTTGRPQSLPLVPAPDSNNIAQGSFGEPELHSTRANSVRSQGDQDNNAAGPLDRIREFNRSLQDQPSGQLVLNMLEPTSGDHANSIEPLPNVPDFRPMLTELDVSGDTMPDTYNPDEFIQSATEAATPSNNNTPNLAVADQAVHETKKLVDTLTKLTSSTTRKGASDTRPNSSASAPAVPLSLVSSPAHDYIQQALRSGSPQALQKVTSYLAPLHNLLNSIPNVANTMRELTNRLDHLENISFSHIQPEEFQTALEMYDGRLLELEHRMDDHDRVHQSIDADQGSTSHSRRRIANVADSFGSNNSLQSTTSSALILAAIDRKDMEYELGEIKDRLDVLEATAPPSFTNTWDIEVVLLPWGTELRGVWFPADEPMHEPGKAVTQNSEEWTQAVGTKNITRSVHSQDAADATMQPGLQHSSAHSLIPSDGTSGWDSQAICDWAAGSSDEWLFPKACGSSNLVYKRLQSRGFVRDVTLRGSNSRDIQATLTTTFHDLMEHLEYDGQDNAIVSSHPGLLASFIPLRKVHKDSRLQFLSPAEMSTSALWSAQFLASGIMMRVSGGKRRLFVTQREAYMQKSDYEGMSWTWQQLRTLPRYQRDKDSQMEGNDEQCQPRVEEGDAKEACWAFYEPYDLPPLSTNSSFSSHNSAPVHLSMRPADRQWRRSITPTSILKNRAQHPLSPLSEKHPMRLGQGRPRTVSTSMIDYTPQGASKRRFNSSPVKQSSAPQPTSRMSSISTSQPKRRRVAQLSSSPQDIVSSEAQVVQVESFKNNPRRSREPPSPFYLSHPELPRTSSDVTNRSQRSVAVTGKGTPFAYATPYSGPLMGGPRHLGGFDDHPGDTEPDDDYDDDDGDVSWGGVDEENGQSDVSSSFISGSNSDVRAGAQIEDAGSFSGDDSGFGSDGEGEDSDNDNDVPEDDESAFGAQRQTDDEDVFDTMLGLLEH